MTTKQKAAPLASPNPDGLAKLREQYGCGPVEFTGTDNALYERHLIFDNIIKPAAAAPREQFEAFARSVRDILSQRWVLTEDTYERENPKRVYYLSMEFLIGRSLANNVTNLLLGPLARQAVQQKDLDWLALLEQEPDADVARPGSRGRILVIATREDETMLREVIQVLRSAESPTQRGRPVGLGLDEKG